MQPINYGVEIEDPTKSFLSAFQTGSAIQDTRLKQEQQQQKIANEKLILQGLAKIRQPNATVEDVSNLAMILPKDQSETVIKAWQLKTDAQKQNALGQAGKVVSALFAGENDIAQQLISDQAVAMRNSGNEEGAKFLETWRGVTEANPAASQNFFTAELLRLPGGDKIVENIVKMQAGIREQKLAPAKLRQALATADKSESDAKIALAAATTAPEIAAAEAALKKAQADKAKIDAQYAEGVALDAIKKRAADLGLTTAQTNQVLATTRKLGIETKKAALELAAIAETGGVDPEKKFTQEEKIRKEYQGRTKMYGELQGTFNTIQASANSANGPGDIALITGFMKMLDPGSVVRETEFATARDTAGLFTQLQNRLEKAQNGQLLSHQQRKEYVALSQKYLDAAKTKANQEKTDLGIVVKNYKLNPENVFGAERPAAPPPAPLPASATVGGKTYPRPAAFTDAQWSDYLKANGVIQ